MPFVVERDGYIVSPYMDWLSFFFDRRWRMKAGDMVPLMVKLPGGTFSIGAQKADPNHWKSLFNTAIVAGFDLGRLDLADKAVARLEQINPAAPQKTLRRGVRLMARIPGKLHISDCGKRRSAGAKTAKEPQFNFP